MSARTVEQLAAAGVTTPALRRLRTINLVTGGVHLAQAAGVLVVGSATTLSLVASVGPDAGPAPVADVPVAPLAAASLLLAAVDHLAVATVLRSRYELDLRGGINRVRWLEYSLSATVMILIVAGYVGILEAAAWFALVGASVATILFGLRMERVNPPRRDDVEWEPFVSGCLVGATPWLAITWQMTRAPSAGTEVTAGVFGVYAVLFVLFASFAANQWLQYARIGRWRSYAFGEASYVALSLVAKSALAWGALAVDPLV